ncbi:assimilatory sulfite reductase (NADPH) flavoprotein subunit [Vibrio breoganii]|uniref:assimilatory sulfite reductase (NADPH) flavoprotein subunit n=1 Tax=Vibrio breoganii TaxID=553239 RepID=UPI000C8425C8|nr:assimilatory sulfite reductase (NADPH) flavoprotein subunit [Vibrio breoganii]PMG93454.1 sulfite reductase [NADPH] flavoprotein, alpha-component [Vibrio breoganii]PMJ46473.1 sulfite reductase [NADPH] flavoprotein, alpha-component [Vibrio breoganii]PMK53089.1 sulfite reductase [NADPH] flavoprotein, alpha-component [Vibrio breoganii]PMK61958.1 sulfite reductase [NADPH] flavoprotein, alpha-component [Vibrio breoganii]PMK64956.1 sulfite reductase [NADPH] flavoprotein, alpha-component [Vibrio br
MLLKDLSGFATPLSDNQANQLKQAAAELSPQQLAWVSGYFYGISQNHSLASVPDTAPAVATASQLSIIFASQTGNAKGVAKQLHAKVVEDGYQAKLYDAADYKLKNLKNETHVVIVASTNGEGEVPDNAIEFYDYLTSKKAPKLDKLQYAVVGLGDSSYEFFCQTGKDFDAALSKLGATAFLDRIDCDVDYESPVAAWQSQALNKVAELFKENSVGTQSAVVQLPVSASQSQYTKQSPYTATLLTNQKITGRDSTKDVRHIEIDLEESGITYQPGDALGVWYKNDLQLVDSILAIASIDKDEQVEIDGETLSIKQALVEYFEVTASNPQFVSQYAEKSGSKKLLKLIEDKSKLREYAARTQVVDVLAEKKTKLSATELIAMLRRLTPRLYSISSSQAEVDEEVHLTVGVVEYETNKGQRVGGASGFLSHSLEEGEDVKVFIEHNNNFKLPTDDNTPVIMIGPGTGIAPFRSFLQERDAREAEGKNWLFFGDRTFTQDFLYQLEFQRYLKDGLLSRLDVAFSRDSANKVYVQDKLKQNAQQVWQWLQDGAYLYICGDADRMAKDVQSTLLEIAQQQGGLNPESAEEWLKDLRKQKRYQRDVY